MNEIKKIGYNMDNAKKVNNNAPAFEVMPLDVNVANMQFELRKRAELEVPENGDFSPVVEKYENNDQRVEISDIKAICRCSEKDKDEREIVVEITNRANTLLYNYSLFSGSKKQLLEYLDSKDNAFFKTIKQFALYVSDQNKRKS